MTDSSNRFRNFTARFLGYEGALVEPIEPDGLEAMLPLELQRRLQAPEFLRLGFAAELPSEAQRAGLESDWLERFGQSLGERGAHFKFMAHAQLPHPSYAENAVERRVTFQNAVYRVSKVEAAWTRYLILLFRYTAISDEKREGVIKLGFNLIQGSAIDDFADDLLASTLDPEFYSAVAKPDISQLPDDWPEARLKKVIENACAYRVRGHIGQFLNGMQRRLDRDLTRVHEYYSGLREESLRKLHKIKGDSARERLRLEAAAREYQSKVSDLKQKYELRVKVEISQILDFICPVQRVTIVIKRRKGERKLVLDWNPIARKLDPLPCEWSFTADGPRIVCDNALHIVRPEGHSPCVHCGKEYCRVCSRRCPKCGTEKNETDEN